MTDLVGGYSGGHTVFHTRILFQERYTRLCHHREPPHPREPPRRDSGEPPAHHRPAVLKGRFTQAFPGPLAPPIISKPFGDPRLLRDFPEDDACAHMQTISASDSRRCRGEGAADTRQQVPEARGTAMPGDRRVELCG